MGYVGLTTGLYFAERGIQVKGYEIDAKKNVEIKSGRVPFFEPGIQQLLLKCLSNNSFEVVDDLTDSDVFFITVGTPSRDDGSINLEHVEMVAKSLGRFLKYIDGYPLVVLTSTVTRKELSMNTDVLRFIRLFSLVA